MIKRTMIATGVALAITTTLTANIALAEEETSFMDELEISGELKNESAVFTKSGQTIGQATSTTDTTTNNSSGDLYKSENTARFFINGDVGEEGSSFHAELNLRYDTEGTDGYKGAKSYSQHDLLRELYVDTEVGNEDNPISIRAGKQQVVWGTADGMKLLDVINPTDYREMAQNTMEDSRIPVWMLNAETDLERGGNLQFVLSQSESNKISGLGNNSATQSTSSLGGAITVAATAFSGHGNGDSGQSFLMKGVDSITGKVNGFLNIAPAMGAVAQAFDRGAQTKDWNGNGSENGSGGGALAVADTATGEDGTYRYVSLRGYTKASVADFATNLQTGSNQSIGFKGFCDNVNTGAGCLANIVNNQMAPNAMNFGANNGNGQNLLATQTDAEWSSNLNAPTQMFHYMPDATFATFDAFVSMKSKYLVDHNSDPILATRFKGETENGLNYSFNISHGNDANPYVDMHWEDNSGNKLTETRSEAIDVNNGNKVYVTSNLIADGNVTTFSNVGGATVIGGDGAQSGLGATTLNGTATDVATLVFTEKTDKITNIGTAFDTSVETESLGAVVLRGEFLYQKDVRSPILTRKASNGVDLNHGFLVSSLQMEKGDRFKYVLGADVTVLTNMMVSAQFIQDRNLDYVDVGNSGSTDWKYTADAATMHLTNGLQKAEENKEFYSFFMSKPFGAEQQHRWNNIFMFEENGGKWNRADVEYSFSDEIIGSAEYNKYWGDENTQFGQMEKSSNFQLGLKYIF